MSRIYTEKETEIEECDAGKCPAFLIDMTRCLCAKSSVDIVLEGDTTLYMFGRGFDSGKSFKKGEIVTMTRWFKDEDWEYMKGHKFPPWCPLKTVED